MSKAKDKTNVMRILDKASLHYIAHEYEHQDGVIDGVSVAKKMGQDPDHVFKTLICKGHSGQYCVFVIPVKCVLDLKKAAKSVGEKSVEMIPVSAINSVTGYIRGGCSPIGMKKRYPTIFDKSCQEIDSIIVSAGKIGYQIEMVPALLIDFIHAAVFDITKDH
ncbi:MAG: Cys-tRNA(Pro) deacylase [Eubacterium sp.]